jgi:hypothetical protein
MPYLPYPLLFAALSAPLSPFDSDLLAPLPIAMLEADPPPKPRCPEGTVLVEGTHYESVQRYCIDHHGPACWAFHPGLFAVEGIETPISTCMDTFEWPNKAGAKPDVMVTYNRAMAKCRSVGKRLCTEFEWELACEGADGLPFPYGYAQEPRACVNEKPFLQYNQAKLDDDTRPELRDAEVKHLYQAEPSGSRPRCTSPFGVVDMVGNVEEWVTTSRVEWKYPSSLKGGYWSKPWSGCRGTNDSHAPKFRFYEVGFRCCTDPSAP